jgi:hypothetical protein
VTAIARKFFRLDLLSAKWIVRYVVLLSALYVFVNLNDFYGYMPYPRGSLKAANMSITAHMGLYLATLEWKGYWRILGVLLLIPSVLGLYLIFWNYNYATVLACLMFLAWLIRKVWSGWRTLY